MLLVIALPFAQAASACPQVLDHAQTSIKADPDSRQTSGQAQAGTSEDFTIAFISSQMNIAPNADDSMSYAAAGTMDVRSLDDAGYLIQLLSAGKNLLPPRIVPVYRL